MHFLELIQGSEEDHPGIADFLEYLSQRKDATLYVSSADSRAIKVLTIHKAKGLGFGVVIVPFLEFDTASFVSRAKNAHVSFAVTQDAEGLSLLRLDKKYAVLSPAIRARYRQEYKKAFIDELNAIYVACTRARNELYVFIPEGRQVRKNAAVSLIPQDCFQRGEPRIYAEKLGQEGDTCVLAPPRYRSWADFIREEFSDVSQVKHRTQRMRGTIAHEILSCVGNLSLSDPEEALHKGLSRARFLFPHREDLSGEEAMVRNVISDPSLREVFYTGKCAVFQEKEVVDCVGVTRRIDRLIVKAEEVWIVDYKTKGESAQYYRQQLSEYRRQVQMMFPGKRPRAFVVFLEDCRLEEIDG